MQHVDIVSATDRMVEVQAAKKPAGFRALLAAYNPWWWLELGDPSPGPFVDSASAVRIGPGGGTWGPGAGPGFPCPPPLHHGLVSAADHAPNVVTGTHLTYQVAGATSDGRKAVKLSSHLQLDTSIEILNTPMTVGDDPPFIGGDSMSVLMWFRYDGGANLTNPIVWGFTNQFNPMYIFMQGYSAQFGIAGYDSGNVIWANSLFAAGGAFDGNWHLVGFNWYGAMPADNVVNVDHFLDGVFVGTATLTASSGKFWGFFTQGEAWSIAQALDISSVTAGGACSLQDVAIFPQGTPCNILLAADYAALYAAR